MFLTLNGTNKVFYYQKLNAVVIYHCLSVEKCHKYRKVHHMHLCILKNKKANQCSRQQERPQ